MSKTKEFRERTEKLKNEILETLRKEIDKFGGSFECEKQTGHNRWNFDRFFSEKYNKKHKQNTFESMLKWIEILDNCNDKVWEAGVILARKTFAEYKKQVKLKDISLISVVKTFEVKEHKYNAKITLHWDEKSFFDLEVNDPSRNGLYSKSQYNIPLEK